MLNTQSASSLPASTHIGRVRLAVSDLDRSIRFYSDIIGLSVQHRDLTTAQLAPQGSSRILLELEAQPGVRPIAPQSRLGLYHTAFLLPSREDLSSFVLHLLRLNVPFGAGDHEVSEALYLTDPDGLTVEVYADRDRSLWQSRDGELVIGTRAIRFENLPQVPPDSWQGAPPATVIGHVHFYVGDLRAARHFYVDGLGFDVMAGRFPGALFIAAGGYHHHVGLNTWAMGAFPATASDARILSWELILPDAAFIEAASERLHAAGFAPGDAAHAHTDPWGIRVVLATA